MTTNPHPNGKRIPRPPLYTTQPTTITEVVDQAVLEVLGHIAGRARLVETITQRLVQARLDGLEDLARRESPSRVQDSPTVATLLQVLGDQTLILENMRNHFTDEVRHRDDLLAAYHTQERTDDGQG